ncbi:MAG: acyl-ACP thioesterase domain-containing protein, partial [Candidatus Hydrogenedentota bacterium]
MRYRHSYEIRRRDTGRDECLTPDALYDYLQETAILHSDSVDLGANSLAGHGLAWILNRVIVHVDRYPRRREVVTIETWANNLRGLYAIREWRALDESGVVFACATSR